MLYGEVGYNSSLKAHMDVVKGRYSVNCALDIGPTLLSYKPISLKTGLYRRHKLEATLRHIY